MATEVVIPQLGITIEKGKIVKWLKSEGDQVKKGEPLFEVETEKLTTEVESPATGILKKILISEGTEVPILTVVAVITEPGEELPGEYLRAIPTEDGEKQPWSGVHIMQSGVNEKVLERAFKGDVLAVPAARKLAREKEVDLTKIKASGPKGTILKKDVEAYLASTSPSIETPKVSSLARKTAAEIGISLEGVTGTGTRGRIMKEDVIRSVKDIKSYTEADLLGKIIPMDSIRRTIARRMTESAFTAPHIYFFTDVSMEEVLLLHKAISPEFEKRYRVKPSINDFLIKAVGLAIREHPLLNATLRGNEIYVNQQINIGLAVALDSGLIVPAIPNADKLGIGTIAQIRADLVERARGKKLTMDEIERGTFTISSLASFDISFFTAILNPPQSGILSVGKTQDQLYLENGEVKAKKIANFGLSVDHRIVDGAEAAAFLQVIKEIMSNPKFHFLHL